MQQSNWKKRRRIERGKSALWVTALYGSMEKVVIAAGMIRTAGRTKQLLAFSEKVKRNQNFGNIEAVFEAASEVDKEKLLFHFDLSDE